MAGLSAGELGGVMGGIVSLLAVVLLSVVAVSVLRAAPRKPSNQLFALFLLLIAGNALTDGLVKILNAFVPGFGVHVGELVGFFSGPRGLLERLGLSFLILDPGVLLYFTATYPRRARMADHPLFVPAIVGTWLGLTAVLLLAPLELLTFPRIRPAGALLILYLGTSYTAAFLLMVQQLRRETSEILLQQQRLLVGAFGIALVFRLVFIPSELGAHLLFFPYAAGFQIFEDFLRPLIIETLVAVGVLAGTIAWALRGLRDPNLTAVRGALRVAALGIGVLIAFRFLPVVALPLGPPDPPGANPAADFLVPLSQTGVFFLRWVLFALIGGYALLRYQVFDIDVRVRRAAEAGVTAASLLAVGGLALGAGAALGPLVENVGPGQLLAIIAFVVAAPFLVRSSRRAARARLPVPAGQAQDSAARRLEMYRASLETSLRAGLLPPESETELRALRRDLDITDEQHNVLLEMARADQGRRVSAKTPDGRLAGRYELGRVLGQGSYGRCLLARDALLGRNVVVKEVPQLGDEMPSLLREARAAGRLNHPNIVTVHDVIEGSGLSYLVMEHAQGGNLRQLLERGAPSRDEAVRLLDDILAGLEAAHAKDIVHGDLKPENILLTAEGRAKLADFGSAYSTAAAGTMVSLPSRPGAGTLAYMAPEQVEGRPTVKASDLYAVAALAHEMLTGKHYLELRGKNELQVREAIVRGAPRLRGTELPAPLRAWLERGLAKHPAQRWASAEEMRAALARAVPAAALR